MSVRVIGGTDPIVRRQVIVFNVDEEQVSFASFIRYDRWVGALVWTPASAIHRRLAPDVLRHAVRRINRDR